MHDKSVWTVVWLALAATASSSSAVELTAVTLFGCDDQGVVDHAFRHNSGPVDAAWDVFLYEGDVFDPAADIRDKIKWLNHRGDHTVKIPLRPGTHTFTFHTESSRKWSAVGMNLFFDGVHDQAAISVKAPMDDAGPPYPAFAQKGHSLAHRSSCQPDAHTRGNAYENYQDPDR